MEYSLEIPNVSKYSLVTNGLSRDFLTYRLTGIVIIIRTQDRIKLVSLAPNTLLVPFKGDVLRLVKFCPGSLYHLGTWLHFDFIFLIFLCLNGTK